MLILNYSEYIIEIYLKEKQVEDLGIPAFV